MIVAIIEATYGAGNSKLQSTQLSETSSEEVLGKHLIRLKADARVTRIRIFRPEVEHMRSSTWTSHQLKS